ncbi:MAG: class I SAM-dependent methyltransferase [Candidatus Hydrothermarchaeaceae archaeon]
MVKERYFDKISKHYDFYTKLFMVGTYGRVRDRILSLRDSREELVLDLCCGTGYLTSGIKALQVVGVDLSTGMLSLNRKKEPVSKTIFLRGDAFNLPFVDEKFDSIYCSLATHEFSYIEPILSEAFRVLKRGGDFIIFDIFEPSFPISRFFVMYVVKYIAELGRMWVYTEEEWREMLKGVGFAGIDIDVLYKTSALIKAGK